MHKVRHPPATHPPPIIVHAAAADARARWPSVFSVVSSVVTAAAAAGPARQRRPPRHGRTADCGAQSQFTRCRRTSTVACRRRSFRRRRQLFASDVCPSTRVRAREIVRLRTFRLCVWFFFYSFRLFVCFFKFFFFFIIIVANAGSALDASAKWTATQPPQPPRAPPSSLSRVGGLAAPTSSCTRAGSKDGWTFAVSFFFFIIIIAV